jgi:predicted transcriptional regulator
MRKLGALQESALVSLVRSGQWYARDIICGWVIDSVSKTRSIMESLVKRGLAQTTVHDSHDLYKPTEKGRQVAEAAHPGASLNEKAELITVEVVAGAGGACLIINDTRVAGPKPWGGGRVTHTFKVKRNVLLEAIAVAEDDLHE